MRTGELSTPAALAGVVIAVLGLDDRPQAGGAVQRAAILEFGGSTATTCR